MWGGVGWSGVGGGGSGVGRGGADILVRSLLDVISLAAAHVSQRTAVTSDISIHPKPRKHRLQKFKGRAVTAKRFQ